jgi:hypothetical protein
VCARSVKEEEEEEKRRRRLNIARHNAQYKRTVKWWYQCRKMTSFLQMTRKTVSTSSGILLKTKSITHKPTAPCPKDVSAGAHTEAQGPNFHAKYSRWGAVRKNPTAENTDSSRFHTASWFLQDTGSRDAIR